MFGNNTLGYWPAVVVSQLVWPGLYMRRKYIFWSGSMDIFFHAPDSRYICSFSITRYGSIPWIIDNERLKIMFFLNRAELTSWAFYFTINSSASGRKNHKLWPAGPVNPTLHGGGALSPPGSTYNKVCRRHTSIRRPSYSHIKYSYLSTLGIGK